MQEINFVNKGYAVNYIPRVLSACILLCFKPYHSEEAVTIKFRNSLSISGAPTNYTYIKYIAEKPSN